jgi:competence protein ComEC
MPPGRARRMTAPVSEYFLLTLAAQLTTLPLIAYHFGRVSLVSLPANLAILPAQPPVMVLGELSVLAGSVLVPLGQALAFAIYPFLAYTIRAVEWFARWDAGARGIGEISLLAVFGFYLALFGITVYWEKVKQFLRQNFRPVVVLAVLVWQTVLDQPDGKLHLTMLDVGSGEAILTETPEGRFVLVGGGESAGQLSEGLGRRLPLFQRQIDVLVVAGTKPDQLASLPAAMPRYPPARVWWAGDRAESRPSRQLAAWLLEVGIPVFDLATGQSLDLGSGVQLIVIRADEQGAALLLTWGGFRCLLPVRISCSPRKCSAWVPV